MLYFAVCLSCQTNDDCSHVEIPIGNKTVKIYHECCREYPWPRTCIPYDPMNPDCYNTPSTQIQTTIKLRQTKFTLMKTSTATRTNIDWNSITPIPTTQYGFESYSSGTAISISTIITLVSVVAVVIIGVTFCYLMRVYQRRQDQGAVLGIPRVMYQQRVIQVWWWSALLKNRTFLSIKPFVSLLFIY